jgi:hypothetical protein
MEEKAQEGIRNRLRSCMHLLNFTSCPACPDIWMRSAIKSDGTKAYEYVLLYTDDALSIGVEPRTILRKEIGQSLMSHMSRGVAGFIGFM